jgi:soluble lytic murein transglycosylase-like protein
MRFVLFAAFTLGSALAGEYAVFTSGSRMRVDRHEENGDKWRLFNGSGYIEVARPTVAAFEAEEMAAATGAPAAPAAPEKAAVHVPAVDYGKLVDEAARRYGLPKEIVRSVVKAESGFQPHAVSPKGAVGLMQLMPDTARALGANPHDPAENVDAGTRYLRELLVKYNGGLWHALAAYNAGPGAVEKYRGIPPYAETRNYIRRIDRDYRKLTAEPAGQ